MTSPQDNTPDSPLPPGWDPKDWPLPWDLPMPPPPGGGPLPPPPGGDGEPPLPPPHYRGPPRGAEPHTDIYSSRSASPVERP